MGFTHKPTSYTTTNTADLMNNNYNRNYSRDNHNLQMNTNDVFQNDNMSNSNQNNNYRRVFRPDNT